MGFLVPLGFSSFEPFVVERGEAEEQNRLEIHLRTEKANFYVLVDDVKAMRRWMCSQLKFDIDDDNKASEPITQPSQPQPSSRTRRRRSNIGCCFWFLVPLVLAVSMA